MLRFRYDADVEYILQTILSRSSAEISEYQRLIKNNPRASKDIPFGFHYQQLLKLNPGDDQVTLVLHADGVSVTRSTKLKMWLFSAVVVELPPKLRNRRSNMVPISIWVGHVEPNVDLWLSRCVQSLLKLKRKGKPCFLNQNQRMIQFYQAVILSKFSRVQ